ncbi:MAG: hypothetical protein H7066_05150 [Cytophagaceae bacterium]|nr:hypothetical protein [Gemmatimonadaceae bacterium]
MRRLARLLAGVGVVTVAACIDITVDSEALGSLQFVPLPYPSVDAGDTLRNASDIVEPLQAVAYRANGTPDPDIPVTFVALDTGLTLPATTNLVLGNALPATTPSRSVRVIASATGLQTTARTLLVVPKADTFATDPALLQDSILYSLPSVSTDVSKEFKVKIGKKNDATILPSAGYIVRYSLKRGTTTIPATDTLGSFTFQDASGRVSAVDTTDPGGDASRVLRYRVRQGQPPVDTVTVLAEAKRGSRLGNVYQWTVRIRPKTQ